MLQLDSPDKGLPDSANFDTYFTTVPDGGPSNVSPLSSSRQYTFSDVTTFFVSQYTYSNNVVVTNNYFQGCIYRGLVYHPPTHNPFA